MIRRASFCCEACLIEVEGDPDHNGVCNCENRRRRTGSAFGWSTYFSPEKVIRIEGDLVVWSIANPGPRERSFCGKCGTTLFWRHFGRPDHIGIAGGTFTEAPLPSPGAIGNNHQKLDWVIFPEH